MATIVEAGTGAESRGTPVQSRTGQQKPGRNQWLAALFTVTAMLGASLLFAVEPLVAKLLLPDYGGSATVWSTSSLFFQIVLLMAYLYAHWSTKLLGPRWQPRVHFLVLCIPLLALPLALPGHAGPGESHPIWWLLRALVLCVGLPFAVLATTGPLLQRWFSWTDHPRAHDPYFLFAGSNLGSFAGLLAYPLVIEPHLTLGEQRAWWSAGCLAFLLLTGVCGIAALRGSRAAVVPSDIPRETPSSPPVRGRRIAVWLALAFLPSTLMLGVTAHLSTDVAAIPLLWVVPLAIYLATFVAAFARQTRKPCVWAVRVAVALAVPAALLAVAPGTAPVSVSIVLDLALLWFVGYAAHARLAADRPEPTRLTQFYVVISIGGALGGLLNGLVAPLVFDRVLEYQLDLLLIPLLLLGLVAQPTRRVLARFPAPAARVLEGGGVLFAMAVCLAIVVTIVDQGAVTLAAAVVAVSLAGWLMSHRLNALLIALVAVAIVGSTVQGRGVIERERSFYGSYRVASSDGVHTLVHGTTVHGTQFLDPDKSAVPTSYYSRKGPLGDVFQRLDDRFDRVGVVGLGAGTIAAYGRVGQSMAFYELDPLVVDMAEDATLFTYLRDSSAAISVEAGDGRLLIAQEPEGSFDLIVLDAFSSDAIPVHLLTREAMAVYASKLTADGVLVVHVSNRVFDLKPVLASAAASQRWSGAVGTSDVTQGEQAASTWVALSRDRASVDSMLSLPDWRPLPAAPSVVWTDDYSSVLSVLE